MCVCVCTTGASGGADSAGPSGTQRDDPMDPLAEETRKMHGMDICMVCVCVVPSLCCVCVAMLEARGIPAHLLGSLGAMGSKMQHILHSKVLSSTNSECLYNG